MSEEQVTRAWEERVISQEEGSRTIHYIMWDTTGYHILAAVGTGRGKHMIYTVARDFMRMFGSTNEFHDGKKRRTRHDVVEWLVSLVSKRTPILVDSKHQRLLDTTPSLQYLMSVMTRFSTRRSPSPSDEESSATVKENSDIVWSGESLKCCEQLTHYPTFCIRGTKIPEYSFVWVMAEGEKDLVGYIEDMYEDQQGEKMVKVRWLNFQEEINFPIPSLNSNGREVFTTRIEQEISAECIDGLAAVLTPNHFEKCLTLLPQSISFGSFFCHSEIINKSVKPFSLRKLYGYSIQPILYTLQCFAQQCKKSKKSTQELEVSAPEETGRNGSKSNKSESANQTIGNQMSLVLDNQGKKCETSGQRMKTKLSSKRHMDNNLVVSEPLGPVPSKVDNNIELLCQDSGIRGCWFRCKILRSTKKCLWVQYLYVDDVDGAGKLEECVPVARVADPDKLGIRCAGRLTVRRWPSDNSSDSKLEVGVAVDARWCDDWWEGVVIGCYPSTATRLQVYLPGESKFLTIERNNVRGFKGLDRQQMGKCQAEGGHILFLNFNSEPGPWKIYLSQYSPNTNASQEENKNECDLQKVAGRETDKRQNPSFSASVYLKAKKLHFKKLTCEQGR